MEDIDQRNIPAKFHQNWPNRLGEDVIKVKSLRTHTRQMIRHDINSLAFGQYS